jgi:hypothetical protein
MSDFETMIGEENFAAIEALDAKARTIRVQNALTQLGRHFIVGLSCCGDVSMMQRILQAQMDARYAQNPPTPDE